MSDIDFFFEIYTGLVPGPEKKRFQPLYRVNVFYPGTVTSVSPYEYVSQKGFIIFHGDKIVPENNWVVMRIKIFSFGLLRNGNVP